MNHWRKHGKDFGYKYASVGQPTKALPSAPIPTPSRTRQNKQLMIFFIEEDNKSLPRIQLLRRKLLRRYGDLSLSFIEWEADMEIEKSYPVSPELFVKVLEPEWIFNIVIPFTSHEEKRTASQVAQHLLLCPEYMLYSDLISCS